MRLIDGKKIAAKIENKLKLTPSNSPLAKGENYDWRGGLGVILAGNDPESHLYVRLKEKAAKRVGINFEKKLFPKNTQKKDIIKKIKEFNKRNDITGIIVQLPLPKPLSQYTDEIIKAIDPKKDADGFHPDNKTAISPVLCATLEALAETGVKLKNKSVLMVSKSAVLPKPFEIIFGAKVKEFKICKPPATKKYAKDADIIITAVGKPHYLKAKMVKKGVIIIDIGIAKKGKKIYGDADPKSLKNKASWLTPVPGGIGPITVACLLKNVTKRII